MHILVNNPSHFRTQFNADVGGSNLWRTAKAGKTATTLTKDAAAFDNVNSLRFIRDEAEAISKILSSHL